MPDVNIHQGQFYPKKWGAEIWLHNSEKYCGKILRFMGGKKFSLHYHLKKTESFYIISGRYVLKTINTDTAETKTQILEPGQVIDIPVGVPHQLSCLESGEIAEFSTQHFEEDSYRVEKGDSQV